MKEIISQLTQKEAMAEMVEILKDFYTGKKSDLFVGLTADGLVDYDFHLSDHSEVVAVFYDTSHGWSLGEGLYLEEWWWEEMAEVLGSQLWLFYEGNSDPENPDILFAD